jgi:glycerol-3-phosphate O-acyltransferase
VAVRINRVTPITPISLVTLALLAAGDRALTIAETLESLRDLVEYVDGRGLPVTEPVDLEDPAMVRAALDALVDHGVVSRFEGGRQVVYAIGPQQHLAAAYYRNTIIHFFTTAAIAEIGLAAADGSDAPVDAFWSTVRGLRDTLKFEFFFPEREEFRAEVAAELESSVPGWEAMLDKSGPGEVIGALRPAASAWVLRPVLEAYLVLADALVDIDFRRDADKKELTDTALAIGRQYAAQRTIASPEAVSTVLFDNAIALAANRGLMEGGPLERLTEREGFARELREMLDLIDRVEDLRKT